MPIHHIFKDKHLKSFQLTDDEVRTISAQCSNFVELDTHIMQMTEEHLLQCLAVETSYRCRFNILHRLYSRYGSLRKNRERLEVFSCGP